MEFLSLFLEGNITLEWRDPLVKPCPFRYVIGGRNISALI